MGEDIDIESSIEKSKVSLKTMVVALVVVVGWVGSLCAIYFPMNSRMEEDHVKIEKLEDRWDKFNPEILSVEIRGMKESINEIKESTKEIRTTLGGH